MYENVWDRQSLLFQIKLLKDRVEAFERIFRRCRTSILFSAGQLPHGSRTIAAGISDTSRCARKPVESRGLGVEDPQES